MKKLIFLFFIVVSILYSCQKDEQYSPEGIDFQEWETNFSIQELNQNASDTIQTVTNDVIISGYVISTDKDGSFYKTIVLQNQEKTHGVSLSVDAYSLYTYVDFGRKIYVNLKGMSYVKQNGTLQIGTENSGKISPIASEIFQSQTAISTKKKSQEELIKVVKLSDLKTNEHLNQLFKIEDVQFSEESIGQKYYEESKAYMGYHTHKIDQITTEGTSFVNTQINQYVKFVNETVPIQRGEIVGVLTKRGSSYNFVLNQLEDVQLTRGRYYPFSMLKSENEEFAISINESFETYLNNQTLFASYINAYVHGGKYWQLRSYQGNKYLQSTAYGNSESITESYFIVPVYFNGSNTLSFQTKDGYYRGDVLKVYYVKAAEFQCQQPVDFENLIEITDHFTISKDNESGYGSTFVDSGTYQFPSQLVGEGYIMFTYKGNPELTTTMQIDNIIFQ